MDEQEQAEAERQDAPRRALETLREHHAALGELLDGWPRDHAEEIAELGAEVETYARRLHEAVDALEVV